MELDKFEKAEIFAGVISSLLLDAAVQSWIN